MGIGLYIHIPFCQSKCHYCDFSSVADAQHLIEPYLEAVKREMLLYKPHISVIDTVYIGGGTPSILSTNNITSLFDSMRRNFYIKNKAEITMEVNPATINMEKLRILKINGVNRLSIGLQSFDNESLQKLGRIHTVEDFMKTYSSARQAGFENINVDLIFGYPWQTREEWKLSLREVVKLQSEHISLYNLTIEPYTKFGRDMQANLFKKMPEELEAELYEEAIYFLKSSGFEHYEISNFAKPGRRCQHNQLYWRNEEYLGLGAGATSFLGRIRFSNVKEIPLYIEKLRQNQYATFEKENLSQEKRVGETIMLNLRLLDGFSKLDLEKRFKLSIDAMYGPTIKVLASKGLLKEDEHNVRLTGNGLLVANQVFEHFV